MLFLEVISGLCWVKQSAELKRQHPRDLQGEGEDARSKVSPAEDFFFSSLHVESPANSHLSCDEVEGSLA